MGNNTKQRNIEDEVFDTTLKIASQIDHENPDPKEVNNLIQVILHVFDNYKEFGINMGKILRSPKMMLESIDNTYKAFDSFIDKLDDYVDKSGSDMVNPKVMLSILIILPKGYYKEQSEKIPGYLNSYNKLVKEVNSLKN